jgi:hypothetical protein
MGRDGADYEFDLGLQRNEIFLQQGLDTPDRSIRKTARRANQPLRAAPSKRETRWTTIRTGPTISARQLPDPAAS